MDSKARQFAIWVGQSQAGLPVWQTFETLWISSNRELEAVDGVVEPSAGDAQIPFKDTARIFEERVLNDLARQPPHHDRLGEVVQFSDLERPCNVGFARRIDRNEDGLIRDGFPLGCQLPAD